MTDATIGYGAKYRIGGVEMAEVTAVKPPGATADRVEATHMQSPGRRREYIAGLIDTGEATFSINWIPGNTTDQTIRTLLASGEIVEHEIEWLSGDKVTFDGAITGYDRQTPIDDRMTADITVATSGEEVWS